MRRALLAVTLLLPLGLSGCVGTFLDGQRDLPAPDFTLVDIDGQTHSLTDYDGRVVLLDFMGTWCPPCKRAMPFLGELQEEYPELTVLSVSATDTEAQLAAFREERNVTWPMMVDTADLVGQISEAATGRDTIIWPTYALLAKGRIVFFNQGETLPATFVTALEEATGHSVSVPWSDLGVTLPAAAVLGALAYHSPFLAHHTLAPALSAGTRRRFLWTTPLVWGLAAMLVALLHRSLVGRLVNLAPVMAAAAVLGLLWWRWKGDAAQADPKGLRSDSSTRQALSLHGNLLYYGAPAWFAGLFAGMLGTWPPLGPIALLVFGAGLAAAAAFHGGRPSARDRLPMPVGWLAMAANLAGGAWALLRYLA